MYMDDLKLFAKTEKEWETLRQAVSIHTDDIGIKFGIEKCAMLIRKSRKRQRTKGIELINQEKKQNARRKNSQVLGNLGSGYY